MNMKLLVFLACVGSLVPFIRAGEVDDSPLSDNWVARLYGDKMKGYNRIARPVRDHSHNTTLRIALSLNHVDIDDEVQELSLNAWTIMTWVDEFLRWEPKNYMNIDKLHFDDDDIWIPDIKVYNSADGADVHPFDHVPVFADSQGQIYWFPPTKVRVKCDLDLTHWPIDQHECMVRMGSWSHHGEQIDIQIMTVNGTQGITTSNLDKNNRWELVRSTATRSLISLEGHDPYVEVDFTLTLKRQASTHAQYITNAALALVVVVVASYFLPLSAFFSRLVMHLLAISSLISCYYVLFDELPANGGPVPLVVRYYSGTIILSTISLISTILLSGRGCCCEPTKTISTSTTGLGTRLASAVTSSRAFRNVVPQGRTSTPYNHLDAELGFDEDEGVVGHPIPPATTTTTPKPDVVEVSVEFSTVRRVINFLLLILFSVAFVVDFVMLKTVAE